MYSHPALKNLWVELIEKELSIQKHTLASGKGWQVGYTKSSTYVSIFNNGTIHCQGIMGLMFGTNSIVEKIYPEVRELAIQGNIKCNANK